MDDDAAAARANDAPASDPVLVTGASGFVGSAIARALLAGGYRVRALCRAESPRANLRDLPLDIVEGDVCDAAAVARAMAGARYLVHAAADYRLWARDRAAIVRTNVEGTRTIMRGRRDRAAGCRETVASSSCESGNAPGRGRVRMRSPAIR